MGRGRKKKPRKFKHLDQAKRGRIIGLCEGGYSFREIAAKVPCDPSTALRTWRKWKTQKNLANLPKAPRRRVTTPRQDRTIFRKTAQNPKQMQLPLVKN
jgi:transposase-like protein